MLLNVEMERVDENYFDLNKDENSATTIAMRATMPMARLHMVFTILFRKSGHVETMLKVIGIITMFFFVIMIVMFIIYIMFIIV